MKIIPVHQGVTKIGFAFRKLQPTRIWYWHKISWSQGREPNPEETAFFSRLAQKLDLNPKLIGTMILDVETGHLKVESDDGPAISGNINNLTDHHEDLLRERFGR
jgi:hypothetical protein